MCCRCFGLRWHSSAPGACKLFILRPLVGNCKKRRNGACGMRNKPFYFNGLREIRLLSEHKRSTGWSGLMQVIEKIGAGDGTRTRDVQLGKTTANWKQRTLRFLHLILAIENTQFSFCALARFLTEHKRSTQLRRTLRSIWRPQFNPV